MRPFAAILCVAGVLAGCTADPLKTVPRLSDTDLAESEGQAAIRATPGDAIVATETAPEAAPPPARGGLLGLLRRSAEDAKAQGTGTTQVAALAATPNPVAPAAKGPSPDDPDYLVVEPGTTLPYGTLARVCTLSNRQLGKRVERYPENRGTYTLYDSQPGNTAAHTFYLTGFDDGCARQFTAAMAIFGAPQTHEQLRYGLPSQVQPDSTTDAAYESLKSRICGVGRGKPCGSAMSRLARNTVFVSVYETFGSNTQWKTILLHDGEVVETDIRSN